MKNGKRALVLICASVNLNTVQSIIKELITHEIDADVFNYFALENFFGDKTFLYNGVQYHLYENIFNCGYANTRMTERSVELAIGEQWLNSIDGEIWEVGAVTPYYPIQNAEKIKHIIDPTDTHSRVDKRSSIFDCDLSGKNVLSISTVEHIGTGDYGLEESYTSVDAIDKILSETKECLITAPTGYNAILDEWVYKNCQSPHIKLLRRNCNNHWYEADTREVCDIPYIHGGWANGLILIEKRGEK